MGASNSWLRSQGMFFLMDCRERGGRCTNRRMSDEGKSVVRGQPMVCAIGFRLISEAEAHWT